MGALRGACGFRYLSFYRFIMNMLTHDDPDDDDNADVCRNLTPVIRDALDNGREVCVSVLRVRAGRGAPSPLLPRCRRRPVAAAASAVMWRRWAGCYRSLVLVDDNGWGG